MSRQTSAGSNFPLDSRAVDTAVTVASSLVKSSTCRIAIAVVVGYRFLIRVALERLGSNVRAAGPRTHLVP